MSKQPKEPEHDELKPCPFCGQVKGLEIDWNYSFSWVVCTRCDASGPVFRIPPNERETTKVWKQGAVRRWNERN